MISGFPRRAALPEASLPPWRTGAGRCPGEILQRGVHRREFLPDAGNAGEKSLPGFRPGFCGMNIGTIGKHEGVCDVKGNGVFRRMFFLPKYGSAQKENFMEFRFLASFGSFSGQVERLQRLSTPGIECVIGAIKQAACKLGLFLEEEAFCPGPETRHGGAKASGRGRLPAVTGRCPAEQSFSSLRG